MLAQLEQAGAALAGVVARVRAEDLGVLVQLAAVGVAGVEVEDAEVVGEVGGELDGRAARRGERYVTSRSKAGSGWSAGCSQ